MRHRTAPALTLFTFLRAASAATAPAQPAARKLGDTSTTPASAPFSSGRAAASVDNAAPVELPISTTRPATASGLGKHTLSG